MFNIALNTFREILRNRFFGLLGFLAVAFIWFSTVLDTLSMGESRRVFFDFGLSFIEITAVAIILFLWGGMLAREIDGRTIYLMLSKPISRSTIIFGKFLGFLMVLGLVFAVEVGLLLTLFFIQGFAVDMLFFLAILGIFLKALSLLVLILFFSTFTSPMLAIFMTGASYVIGHSGYILLEYAKSAWHTVMLRLAEFVLVFFPNLESLNLKNLVAMGIEVDINPYLMAYGLNIVYIVILLFLAGKLFEKRSFDNV